jgi:predicted phosphoribosyltransferase
MPFANRAEAGRKLAVALTRYKREPVVVLALPRGGLPVAREIALALDAPLDLLIVRKIGVPFQPELAMGAVADGPQPLTVRNPEVIRMAGVTEAEFEAARQRELEEVARRRRLYLGGRPHPDLAGRIAIIVDDGIATGATTRAALQAARKQGVRSVVLAVPVAPTSSLEELRAEADDIVCLEDHEFFGAIGNFYLDFDQVSDDEVKAILAEVPAVVPAGASRPARRS